MYDYSYYGDYGYDSVKSASILAGFGAFTWIISMAISVFTIVCNWKIFKKAGKKGWESIVPIYNVIVELEIVELPMWYIALLFVPIANIYAVFKINIELAKKFGKSTGFGVGLVLLSPIFRAILAFSDDAVYEGNDTQNSDVKVEPISPNVGPQTGFVQPAQPAQPVQPVQPVQPEPQIQPVQPAMSQVPVQPEVQVQPTNNYNMNTVAAVEQAPIPTLGTQQPVQNNQEPQVQRPMFCTSCGAPILENARFCTNCGKQL